MMQVTGYAAVNIFVAGNENYMKKIGFLLLIAVVIAGGIFIYLWNKPPETVDGKKAIALTSVNLSRVFQDNEKTGNDMYLNKVIAVSGTIAEVSKNQDGKTVLLLSGDDPLSGVQCTMRDNKGNFEVGKPVTVKGFCNGYTVVVLLSDCVAE